MKPAPTLNTVKPHGWACVVSGVFWAAYKLSSAGTLIAETTRGPLIVWATATGEGEDLPTLHAPTLSALEEQTAKVNMRAAFERLLRAGGGRRNVTRFMRKLSTRCYECGSLPKEFSAYISSISSFLYVRARYGNRKRGFVKKYEIEDRAWINDFVSLFQYEDEEYKIKVIQIFKKIDDWPRLRNVFIQFAKALQLHVALQFLLEDRKEDIERVTSIDRHKARLVFATLLKHLEAAAYRAHLAKRVKPHTRCTRIPRPPHARPRPPTAPTAPPLLEA